MARDRTPFFLRPEFARALDLIDGWAKYELGLGHVKSGIRERHTRRSGSTAGPSFLVPHVIVSKALDRMGKPPILQALLLARYPRISEPEGLVHRRSFESIHLPALAAFQEATGASERQIERLLEEIEKGFIRRLAR